MAATISVKPATRFRIFEITGDSSYVTGGYSVATEILREASQGGTSAPIGINDGAAVIALYDSVNQKVKFITASTGAEVANASNQSAVTVRIAV